ncbi:BICD family-like cargo adapter 2 [Chanos chanos]|uniref:BICD family-like cargo adapter 2 n=1 Tax=Chanos chanos TaxID=29144 RepID=A0A6J2WXE4_CHACN|nr:BICD family-like cargo adapter 2 [Chanos chanos]
MFPSRKESLPSPSLEDSFFPFSSSSSSTRMMMAPGLDVDDLARSPQDVSSPTLLEKDLILAAEVGRALVEKCTELGAQLEQREREMEVLQQEKHMLQQRLEMQHLEASQREEELQADISALQEQLQHKLSLGRDRRREESEQLTQLSNHNQKLVEQLAEAVSLEHTLRSEIRALRDEMDDTSFSRSISSARMDSLQAENKVLQERYANLDSRLQSTLEDNDRLRAEKDGLRQRVAELQSSLKEKESELEQEHSVVFQLRTVNRTLEQRIQALGEEVTLGESVCFPLSLQSEIQQSQATEAILTHSAILQARDKEIESLKEELQSKDTELRSLREEFEPFRSSPGKPSYRSLEEEIILARQERDSLNQQLMNTIKHKVALSQEVDAWQEDMRLVICQQVQLQEQERQREKQKTSTLQRGTRTSKSLRLRGEDGKKSFFSSLFGGD